MEPHSLAAFLAASREHFGLRGGRTGAAARRIPSAPRFPGVSTYSPLPASPCASGAIHYAGPYRSNSAPAPVDGGARAG